MITDRSVTMPITTVRQALRRRCAEVPLAPAGADPGLSLAELATSGLWIALHAGLVPREEDAVRSVLAEILRLGRFDIAPTALAPVVVGATDPVVDLDHPILRASLEILEESGAASITLEEVSRRAGVSHRGLCSTFTDAPQLLADQIAFVVDDVAVEGRLQGVPAAQAQLADQIAALHDERRATATFRLLTLSGLTRDTVRSSVDIEPYLLLAQAGQREEVARLRVALLALDAQDLAGSERLAADVGTVLARLVEPADGRPATGDEDRPAPR